MPVKYKAPDGAFHKEFYTVFNSVTNIQNDVSITFVIGEKNLSYKKTLLPPVLASIITKLQYPVTAHADRVFIKY